MSREFPTAISCKFVAAMILFQCLDRS